MRIRHPAAPGGRAMSFEAEGAPTPTATPAAPAVPTAAAPVATPAATSVPVTHYTAAQFDAVKKTADDATAAAAAAKASAEGVIERFHAQLVRAEVKVGAALHGLAHPDFLKLIDTSAVKVNSDGDVVVPADFWSKAKAALPHLFHATGADRGTTSQTAGTPKPAPPAGKKATDMTADEFRAAMRRIEAGQTP